jgi:hypothetical protein
VWGVSLRYDLDGDHPLVGQSVPDFELLDGRKVGDLLDDGRGLLLDFDARAPLQALAHRWRERVSYVAAEAKNSLNLSAVLVRPDGFVAWTSEIAPAYEKVAEATLRWFGKSKES